MKLTWRVQGLVSCHQCLMTAPGNGSSAAGRPIENDRDGRTVILEPQEIEVDQEEPKVGDSLDRRVLAPLGPFQRAGRSLACCGLRVS